MHHGLHVGPRVVNGQVHQDLAGALALAGDLLALHVHRADVVRLEEALADAGGGAEHAVLADATGVVALVAGAESLEPDAPADLAHLLLELELADAAEAVAVCVGAVLG